MAAIKSIEQSSDKWVKRASVAGPDYQAGIQNPRRSWAAAAKEAESNYKSGVTAAATAGRYGAGVTKTGDEGWKSMSLRKGPGRFAEGVAIGKDEWNKGFAPYQSAISTLTLPPRQATGSAANIQRVSAVATALRTLKEKGGK